MPIDYLESEADFTNKLLMEVEQLEKVDIDSLARREVKDNFEKALPLFEVVRNTALDAKSLNLSQAPNNVIQIAYDRVFELNRKFHSVLNLRAEVPDFAERRTQLINEIRDYWRSELAPAISNLHRFALAESTLSAAAVDMQDTLQKLNSELYDAQIRASKVEAFLIHSQGDYEGLAKKAKGQIDEIETLLGKLGSTLYMERFEKEAKEHNYSSWAWLGATALFGYFIYRATNHFIHVDSELIAAASKNGVAAAISAASTRLLTLSVLTVGLFLSVRNYSACRHNYIVNKHRINALGTFELFRSAADDDETKKAVLLQSMKAVFEPQGTGYQKTADEPQRSTQIIELFQSAVKHHDS